MKTICLITAVILALTLSVYALADPIKCIVAGKTLYTDDAKRCVNGDVKPINGNIVISSFPKGATPNSTTPMPTLEAPTLLDSILQRFGLSQHDVAAGWKTVMDARERGSWKAPEMPDDEK
jgi:hypothetical protein